MSLPSEHHDDQARNRERTQKRRADIPVRLSDHGELKTSQSFFEPKGKINTTIHHLPHWQ